MRWTRRRTTGCFRAWRRSSTTAAPGRRGGLAGREALGRHPVHCRSVPVGAPASRARPRARALAAPRADEGRARRRYWNRAERRRHAPPRRRNGRARSRRGRRRAGGRSRAPCGRRLSLTAVPAGVLRASNNEKREKVIACVYLPKSVGRTKCRIAVRNPAWYPKTRRQRLFTRPSRESPRTTSVIISSEAPLHAGTSNCSGRGRPS